MFDFPQSPASGTEVMNGGARYRYDGIKWVAVGGTSAWVAKAGDVMSGPLTLPGNALAALQAVPLQQVPVASATLPAMDGTPAAGSATAWSKGDHIHPTDTSRAAASALGNYVAKAGDTMWGNLTIDKAGPEFRMNATAGGQERNLWGMTGGTARWVLQLGAGGAETGGNVGTDFAICRYSDVGAFLSAPIVISRASGNMTLDGAVSAPSGFAIGQVSGNAFINYYANHHWQAGVDTNSNFFFYDASTGRMPMYLSNGGQVVIPGSTADPIQISSPYNMFCRMLYTVNGTRTWSAGITPGGDWVIADESVASYRMLISTTGTMYLTGAGIAYNWWNGNDAVAFPYDGRSCGIYINTSFIGRIVHSYQDANYTPPYAIALNGGSGTVGCWYGNSDYVSWPFTWSDRRLKQNIKPAKRDALELVNRLRIYECDYKAPMADAPTEHLDFSVIADEVAEALPSAYSKGPDLPEGKIAYDQVRELPLIAALWRAVQQLTERVEELEATA